MENEFENREGSPVLPLIDDLYRMLVNIIDVNNIEFFICEKLSIESLMGEMQPVVIEKNLNIKKLLEIHLDRRYRAGTSGIIFFSSTCCPY